jgi:Ca-activated chloride channel family protein
MRSFAAAIVLFLQPALPAAADDARLAYELFEDGRYAEAAEIFTDPAWKGAALYRSEQYWRAAEAYVRATDVDSLYNLGNCYVQLGYLELALEAYLGVLARAPGHADAAHNADLMREMLKSRNNGKGAASSSAQSREIERLETDREGAGRPDGTEGGSEQDQQSSASGDQQPAGEDRQDPGSAKGGGAGEAEREQARADRTADAEGTAAGEEQAGIASGQSEATGETAPAEAAATRTMLERSQADEQWLNQIEDDPASFLKKRIALEMRRRQAAGVLPAAEDGAW